MITFDEFKNIVTMHGQEHLIKLYERLDDKKKNDLINQVLHINFDEVNNLYSLTKNKPELGDVKIEPIEAKDEETLTEDEKNELIKIGEEAIKNKKYAVIMMAGGQGTRLGHTGPKGTFDFGLDSHKTIFEVCGQIKKSKRKIWSVYSMVYND